MSGRVNLLPPVLLAVVIAVCLPEQVATTGLGDEMVWREGALLNKELGQDNEAADAIFKLSVPANSSGEWNQFEDFLKLVKESKVDVVAPSKDLLNTMNLVSTKTRVLFLSEFERYFKELQVGSTSRPMLLTYLGLRFASDQQLASWYEPTKRRRIVRTKIVGSCKALFEKRRQSTERMMGQAGEDIIERARTGSPNKFYLPYLVFQNNQNLFMLETYLLLCQRLEPEELSDEIPSLDLGF